MKTRAKEDFDLTNVERVQCEDAQARFLAVDTLGIAHMIVIGFGHRIAPLVFEYRSFETANDHYQFHLTESTCQSLAWFTRDDSGKLEEFCCDVPQMKDKYGL